MPLQLATLVNTQTTLPPFPMRPHRPSSSLMNCRFTKHTLALPFASQPTRLAIFVHMLLRADECGIVRQTLSELSVCSGIPHPTVQAAISQFNELALISCEDGVIQFIEPSIYWERPTEPTPKKRTRKKERPPVPSGSAAGSTAPLPSGSSAGSQAPVPDASASAPPTIEQREAAFKARFATELERWLAADPNRIFPEEEQAAFIDYWTAHNEQDRKMWFEQQTKFYWQQRFNTWMRNKQDRYRRAAEIQKHKQAEKDAREQTMLDNVRRLDEQRAAYQKSLQSIPEGYTPYTWYQELKRRADLGDAEAIKELQIKKQ